MYVEQGGIGAGNGKSRLHPGGENRAKQVREIMNLVSVKIIKPLSQSLLFVEQEREASIQDAKEKYNRTINQIHKLRDDAKVSKISSLRELKNNLRKDVEGITDPAGVAEEYVRQAQKDLESNDVNMGYIMLPMLGIAVLATLYNIYIRGLFVFTSLFYLAIFNFLFCVPLCKKIKQKIDQRLNDKSNYRWQRSAALADLVLDLWRKKISAEYDNACSEVRSRFQQETERINPRFYPLMAQANDSVREFNAGVSLAEAPWDHPYWQDWSPAKEPAVSLRFGTVRVDTSW
ncbi:SF-assemblin family protein [Dethiobacter alkaliphilus]|uniref:hypothetical protein n=1 Tax=Dethiobacter alkaliphilus TaxID=427926 RepID=UPI002227EF45|nr:hypothetical protein [Dethiobacter alkaliphilus]MCW3488673.1 hypothetical protein [Dethiobacter alkaliphilus]